MYALKSRLLTTASLLSINCRVMYQNTANDNFSFKRTCRPYLWPLRVMSAWLMRDVCVCACVYADGLNAPDGTDDVGWLLMCRLSA